ncbi:hypothetical protein CEXT_657031 [Caerostris extrusa]|uniref:Uncharacterized protein n=1 Tax=Caerostris extrusa TaxID=172846 RepID=A0AAV4M6V3_CAEEX|nr:hypothetical protein CEXT_657031 [Caerostris extrusa]
MDRTPKRTGYIKIYKCQKKSKKEEEKNRQYTDILYRATKRKAFLLGAEPQHERGIQYSVLVEKIPESQEGSPKMEKKRRDSQKPILGKENYRYFGENAHLELWQRKNLFLWGKRGSFKVKKGKGA